MRVMKMPATIERGFTLTELVMTLAIAGILAALAAPAFTDFIADNRLITTLHTIKWQDCATEEINGNRKGLKL